MVAIDLIPKVASLNSKPLSDHSSIIEETVLEGIVEIVVL